MAVEQLTDDDYRRKLDRAPMAVVDFYAAWCGNCVIFSRRFTELSEEYPHIQFFVCDGDRSPAFRGTVDIEDVPYFGLYRDGVLVDGFSTSREEAFRRRLEACFGRCLGDVPIH
ncbi:MAG: thioredoxin family protein [Sandaracinaceae bacterium]|nr:thioredoxin family protein [Sandaracinaceae bacterium]